MPSSSSTALSRERRHPGRAASSWPTTPRSCPPRRHRRRPAARSRVVLLQASVPPRRIGAGLLTGPTEVVLGRHPEGKGGENAEHEPPARAFRDLAQEGGDAGERPE